VSALIVWLDRVATPRRVLILLVLEVLVLAGENLLVFPLSVPYFRRLTGHAYLDMCAFCSADRIYADLDAFGAAGRRLQLLLFATVDVIVPTLSGAFGAMGIALLTRSRRRARPGLRWWVLVPVVAALLDLTENALIALLTIRYPERTLTIATLSGLVTGMKTIAYVLTAALLTTFAPAGARIHGAAQEEAHRLEEEP
jgi:hypothetical protein